MTQGCFASVAISLSLDRVLDYEVPEEMRGQIQAGSKVKVPLRGGLSEGFVIFIKDSTEVPKTRPIRQLMSAEAILPPELLHLSLWIGSYYGAPLSKVIKSMLPPSIRGEGKEKKQLFVSLKINREDGARLCMGLRKKSPSQAAVLDVLLPCKKGMFLSEIMEKAGVSRSPISTLAKNDVLNLREVQVDRSPLKGEEYFRTKPKTLNEEQAEALKSICQNLEPRRFATHLLYGITGSGKTEVYLQAIDRALELGLGTIMLIPEISLTAQTVERFRSRFEGHIAILHHRLSPGERFDEWQRLRKGEAKIAIGARSAIFSPVQNLGLVIVDEEHEQSYKQSEEAPCYHARDVAVMRGKFQDAVVLLGSATPSLESFHNAQKGRYILNRLTSRADSARIPKVEIIDMKREYERQKGYTLFSDALLTGIRKRHERGEQSLLFLNRRGYHSFLTCQKCSHVINCPHCDVSLTYHVQPPRLNCHLCGFERRPPPRTCEECGSDEQMKFRGAGTEQVERALHRIFPEIRTLRMDADTTRHKGSHDKIMRDFRTGKGEVLIGTQMIAKGLHFPQVTLVGVLNSDASLNIPDFRASEQVFQILTQVSGRSGRGPVPGEVIIQTSMPENETIQLASQQDFDRFYEREIEVRKLFAYPPFARMSRLILSGKDEEKTLRFLERIRGVLVEQLPAAYQINPVLPCGYAKIKDHFRFQFLLRGPNNSLVVQSIEKVQRKLSIPSTYRLSLDIDPLSTHS